jgi:hypothetical protein
MNLEILERVRAHNNRITRILLKILLLISRVCKITRKRVIFAKARMPARDP